MAAACVRSAWLVLGSTSLLLEDPTKGYFCTELDLGFPAVREVVENRPDQDGVDDRTRYFGSRVVSANISALAGAGAQIDAVAASFAPFMLPSARPVLHYVLDRPGAPERTLTLRASAYAWPIAGPFQRDINLQWVAADPIARDGIVRSATAWAGSSSPPGRQYNLTFNRIYPPGSAAPTTAQIHPTGDVMVFPVYRLYGPVTGGRVAINTYTGAGTLILSAYIYFLSTFTIGSGQWVDVDSANKTAVLSDGTSVQSQMDWNVTRFTGIGPSPGYATMIMQGTSTSGSSQVVASWQEGYLS